jgi:DNA-binding NarL/FixJ family response regulator
MTAGQEGARIFLIDDHPAVRKGLRLLLSQEAHIICGEAESSEETRERIGTSGAHIALLDLSLGDESGLDLITEIRMQGISVLIYSMHEDADSIEKACAAGADGYVSKREKEDQLLLAVADLLSGNSHFSPRIAQALTSRVFIAPQKNPVSQLSTREQQLLTMLGQGETNIDMAAVFGISVRTIETYFARVIVKLGLGGMKELRRFAIKHYHQ